MLVVNTNEKSLEFLLYFYIIPFKVASVKILVSLEIGAEIKKSIFLFIIVATNLIVPGQGQSEPAEEKFLEAIEFLSGYSWGDIRVQKHYRSIPFIVDFDFNLKPCISKFNLHFSPLLQFQIEPYVCAITSPNANVETGIAFLLKFGFLPAASKIQPYIKFGAGLSFMSLHTREQSTQFNFIEPCALGVHYFFKKNTALTVEGRRRHLSNCSIKIPNGGINTNFILVGVTHRF
ncbi:MAG: acyloxyacyl hydrolase [Candidatus Omnitrophota bacterium]